MKTDFEPIPVIFDFYDYPGVSSYIAARGKGQLYQQAPRDDDDTYIALTKFVSRQETVPQVLSHEIKMGPDGILANNWSYLSHCIKGVNISGNWIKLINNDALTANIGYNGTLDLATPPILAGECRITSYYAYDPSVKFIGKRGGGSQAGLTNFRLDSRRLADGDNKRICDGKMGDVQDCFNIPLASDLSGEETAFEFVVTYPLHISPSPRDS